MNPYDILDAIGEADDHLLVNARKKPIARPRLFLSLAAAAACLGLVAGVFTLGGRKPQLHQVDFPEVEYATSPGIHHTSGNLMEGITAEVISESADLTNGREALTDFSLDLFLEAQQVEENTLLSPLSVLCALGMTANGAEEETLAELEAIFGMDRDTLNLYLHTYLQSLPQGEAYKLKLANSIWFRDDPNLAVGRDFLQKNANFYDATLYQVPFNAKTLGDINNWVSQKTDGMIPAILDEIPERAVMYLINALAFEADWEEAFPLEEIKPGAFITLSGERQTVDMMTSTENRYLNDGNARGFIKYFKDQSYAFVALLPNEGMTPADYLATLDGKALSNLLANPTEEKVEVFLPRFQVAYEADLIDALHKMGVERLFDQENANLSSLGQSKENLFASRVIHKTFFAIGETGARAGAATAVEIKEAEGIIEHEAIFFNRPFVYMLIDTQTNLPFFIGSAMSME